MFCVLLLASIYWFRCPLLPQVPSVFSVRSRRPLLWSHQVHTRFFFFFFSFSFYGNNTQTQLGLIQPCPRSPCPTAELSMLQGVRPVPNNGDQHQSNQRLILPDQSSLSANQQRERSGWNGPITRGTVLLPSCVHWNWPKGRCHSCVFPPWKFGAQEVLFHQSRSISTLRPIVQNVSRPRSVADPSSPYCHHFLFRWSRCSSVTRQ